MWLKQPDGDQPWMAEWKETVLADGVGAPDTFLIPINITDKNTSTQAIITAGFFSKSLDLWWTTDESKPWTTDNVGLSML